MKRMTLMFAVLPLLVSPLWVLADDAHHLDKAPPPKTAATAPAPEQTAALREQMHKARALMERIRTTNDPKQRQALLEEHMKLMQEGMDMMGAMAANTSAGKPQAGMMGRGEPMMKGCMDMMHQMMEHMHTAADATDHNM